MLLKMKRIILGLLIISCFGLIAQSAEDIVKKVDEKKIYLQTNGTIPIDCYYHVYAERKDVERLIVEYEGTSAKDYPGEDWLNLR